REAIQAANTDSTVDACPAGSGADTIVLAAGTYTLTIAGASEDANATGDFDITNALTIIGAGPAATVINANGLDRAFHAIGSATLGLQSLTIQKGLGGPGNPGGAVRADAALTLSGTRFVSNTVTGSTYGGAVIAYGPVVVTNTVFAYNQSSDRAPGLYAVNNAALWATDFLTNSGPAHGGAAFLNGTVSINGGLWLNNRANWTGALVVNGTLNMTGAQFIDNKANTFYAGALQLNGNGRIVNSLFARNHGFGSYGDIYLQAGNTEIIHTTIASPTLEGSAAVYVEGGTLAITDTIIANHARGIDRAGGAVSEDYNLFFSNTVDLSGTISSGGNSLIGLPQFQALVCDNYRLGTGSAAIDSGINAGIAVDADGNSRPLLSGYDIGYNEALTTTPEVGLCNFAAASSGWTIPGNPTYFTASVSAGTNVAYQWDFGDGNTSSGAVVSHTYAGIGVYTATVTGTNSLGAQVLALAVTVNDIPITGLGATSDSPTTLGNPTAFTATVSGGSNISYT
ncbi:MAG: PKD domain-containing protein, partial [Thermoflexales bacterium]|nr:PKD domain-containing protein [Thermoflexales bacterium]